MTQTSVEAKKSVIPKKNVTQSCSNATEKKCSFPKKRFLTIEDPGNEVYDALFKNKREATFKSLAGEAGLIITSSD